MNRRFIAALLSAGLAAGCETTVDVLTISGSDASAAASDATDGAPDLGPPDGGAAVDSGPDDAGDGGALPACARLEGSRPAGGSWTDTLGYVQGSTLVVAKTPLTFAANGYDPGDLLAMPPRSPRRNITIFPHRAEAPSTGSGLLDHPLIHLVGHDEGCPYTALSAFALTTGEDEFPQVEARPIGTNCAPPESVSIRVEDEVIDARLILNFSGLHEPRVLVRTTDGALWRFGADGIDGPVAHRVTAGPATNPSMHDRTYLFPHVSGPRLMDARAVTFAESDDLLVLVADTVDASSVRWSFDICGAERAAVAWLGDRMIVAAPCEGELVLSVARVPLDLGWRPSCERCELDAQRTVGPASSDAPRPAVAGDARDTIAVAFWTESDPGPSVRFFDPQARPRATGRLALPVPRVDAPDERGPPAALAIAGHEDRWAVAYAYAPAEPLSGGVGTIARFSTCEAR